MTQGLNYHGIRSNYTGDYHYLIDHVLVVLLRTMTSANNLGLGKNPKVREIKIRNLTRILMGLEEGTISCEDYYGEDREWHKDELEFVIRELREDIKRLKDKHVPY